MKEVQGFKIWELPDGNWIWGTLFGGAIQAYMGETGMDLDDIFPDGEIESKSMEISEENLDGLEYTGGIDGTGSTTSFREELNQRIDAGDDVGTFACVI